MSLGNAARAEGEDIVLGGWMCQGGTCLKDSLWFSVRLNKGTALWAYEMSLESNLSPRVPGNYVWHQTTSARACLRGRCLIPLILENNISKCS